MIITWAVGTWNYVFMWAVYAMGVYYVITWAVHGVMLSCAHAVRVYYIATWTIHTVSEGAVITWMVNAVKV